MATVALEYHLDIGKTRILMPKGAQMLCVKEDGEFTTLCVLAENLMLDTPRDFIGISRSWNGGLLENTERLQYIGTTRRLYDWYHFFEVRDVAGGNMDKITWDNGYIEFFENSIHAVQGKRGIFENREMFAQYADITKVDFYAFDDGDYSVEWLVGSYNNWLTCPVAKGIFDELTKRLREHNKKKEKYG